LKVCLWPSGLGIDARTKVWVAAASHTLARSHELCERSFAQRWVMRSDIHELLDSLIMVILMLELAVNFMPSSTRHVT
jgi:hypothetical protein